MDFSEIVLSRKEENSLRKLSKNPLIKSTIHPKVFDRLIRLDFAEDDFVAQIDSEIIRDHAGKACISDLGRDYLHWLDEKKAGKKREDIRYWITTAIAVAAWITAIVSIVLQYL